MKIARIVGLAMMLAASAGFASGYYFGGWTQSIGGLMLFVTFAVWRWPDIAIKAARGLAYALVALGVWMAVGFISSSEGYPQAAIWIVGAPLLFFIGIDSIGKENEKVS